MKIKNSIWKIMTLIFVVISVVLYIKVAQNNKVLATYDGHEIMTKNDAYESVKYDPIYNQIISSNIIINAINASGTKVTEKQIDRRFYELKNDNPKYDETLKLSGLDEHNIKDSIELTMLIDKYLKKNYHEDDETIKKAYRSLPNVYEVQLSGIVLTSQNESNVNEKAEDILHDMNSKETNLKTLHDDGNGYGYISDDGETSKRRISYLNDKDLFNRIKDINDDNYHKINYNDSVYIVKVIDKTKKTSYNNTKNDIKTDLLKSELSKDNQKKLSDVITLLKKQGLKIKDPTISKFLSM